MTVQDLGHKNYLTEMLNKFQFKKRTIIVQNMPTLMFWNKLRSILIKQHESVFDPQTGKLNVPTAIRILRETGLTAQDTFAFFDTLFDILWLLLI